MRYLTWAIFVAVLAMVLASCSGGISTPSSEKDGSSATVLTPKINLLTAIDQEKIDIVQIHMNSGTNPNETPIPVGITLEGAYPLHLAVVKGNIEIVRILINNGAQLDLKANNKEAATPLHWAAFYIQKDMVSLLIESGAPINALDENNATPLDAATFAAYLSQKDVYKSEQLTEIQVILKANGGKTATDL